MRYDRGNGDAAPHVIGVVFVEVRWQGGGASLTVVRKLAIGDATGMAVLLAIILASGGGTRVGFIGDVIGQYAAVAMLVLVLASERRIERLRTLGVLAGVTMFAAYLVVVCLQIVLIGAPVLRQLEGVASALVPLSVFLAAVSASDRERLVLANVILVFGGVSVLIGLVQLAQGPQSPLRPYEITNPSEAVGLFANRNHFAALCYVTLAFSSAWLAGALGTKPESKPGSARTGAARSALRVSVGGVLVLSSLVGVAMARSRAGVALAMLGLAASAVLVLRSGSESGDEARTTTQRRAGGSRRSAKFGFLILSLAAFFVLQFGLGRVLTRFEGDLLDDLRIPLFWTTLDSALAALPLGTGVGSFVETYAAAEKSSDLFSGYANRAHNDFAELFLEIGLLAPVLIAAFVGWFVFFCGNAWQARTRALQTRRSREDCNLRRASSVCIGSLLLHSAVDYPLRTGALAAVFALCCGVLSSSASMENSAKIIRE